MGWGNESCPSFVLRTYENEGLRNECETLIDRADVVIIGSAPDYLIQSRLKAGKLTFRYSERIYKKGCRWYELPARAVKYYFKHGRYKNLYLLCASAYTAVDYAKTCTFINKAYKWGYFPEVKQYPDIDQLLERKKRPSILWVGRLIGLKHPDASILLAEKLKNDDYDFDLNIIGNGEMEAQLKGMIQEKQLGDCVHMLGAMTPEEVRAHMERADVFLFTSDFNEGWGAVLNESMNSACAVVASHAIGSVPFLVKDGENGFIYKNGDSDDLYKKVAVLLADKETREGMGRKAYHTIINTWNAEVAAERFLKLAEALQKGASTDLFEDGPCSKAGRLKNDWYKG